MNRKIGHTLVKRSRRKIALIPLLVALNVVAAFLAYRFYEACVHPYDVRMANGQIEVSSLSDLRKQVQKISDDSMMKIQLNLKPDFTNQGSQGDFFIANSADNRDAIQVTVYLKDSHEQVLKSETLRPGATLSGVGLAKKLKKGNYAAVAQVSFLNQDEKLNAVNEIDMTLHIS